MTDTPAHPPKVFPGPVEHGHKTWLCTAEDVPAGYEWRGKSFGHWEPSPAATIDVGRDEWVQVRRGMPTEDSFVMTLHGDDRIPITFGEIEHVITRAVADDHPASDPHPVALAVWFLLVDGETPR